MAAPRAPSLIDLPPNALRFLFRMMDPLDVVAVSLISRRAASIVQRIHPSLDQISIRFQQRFTTITLKGSIPCLTESEIRILNRHYSVCDADDVLHGSKYKRAANICTGIKALKTAPILKKRNRTARALLAHVCRIFGLPVSAVTVWLSDFPRFSQLYIWTLLGACETVNLAMGNMNDDHLAQLLSTFRIERRLHTFAVEEYSMARHFRNIKDLDELKIEGRGFNNTHLLLSNNRIIEVDYTNVTALGVYEWVKQWLAGTQRRAQQLIVRSRFVLHTTRGLQDINCEWVREPPPQSRMVYRVTRSDGSTAQLYFEREQGDESVEISLYYREER